MKALSFALTKEVREQAIVYACAVLMMIAILMILSSPAFAGTDGTFDTAYTKFKGFLEGSGGKLITIIALAGGILGMAKGGFSLGQVAIPVGVGVGIGTGVPIVTSTVTALI